MAFLLALTIVLLTIALVFGSGRIFASLLRPLERRLLHWWQGSVASGSRRGFVLASLFIQIPLMTLIGLCLYFKSILVVSLGIASFSLQICLVGFLVRGRSGYPPADAMETITPAASTEPTQRMVEATDASADQHPTASNNTTKPSADTPAAGDLEPSAVDKFVVSVIVAAIIFGVVVVMAKRERNDKQQIAERILNGADIKAGDLQISDDFTLKKNQICGFAYRRGDSTRRNIAKFIVDLNGKNVEFESGSDLIGDRMTEITITTSDMRGFVQRYDDCTTDERKDRR